MSSENVPTAQTRAMGDGEKAAILNTKIFTRPRGPVTTEAAASFSTPIQTLR